VIGVPTEQAADLRRFVLTKTQGSGHCHVHVNNHTGGCIGPEVVRDTVHMPSKAKRAKTPMSQSHKEALAVGREEGRAVRRYLEALDAHKPKRGRKRSPESIQKRLEEIDDKLQSSDSLSRVHLVQERMDLEYELMSKDAQIDLAALEEAFIKAAKNYSQRKGITYAAWREAGVDAAVLRQAGIRRGSGD
jgi:hypothetical protein